jgi:hypothetical protein
MQLLFSSHPLLGTDVLASTCDVQVADPGSAYEVHFITYMLIQSIVGQTPGKAKLVLKVAISGDALTQWAVCQLPKSN